MNQCFFLTVFRGYSLDCWGAEYEQTIKHLPRWVAPNKAKQTMQGIFRLQHE